MHGRAIEDIVLRVQQCHLLLRFDRDEPVADAGQVFILHQVLPVLFSVFNVVLLIIHFLNDFGAFLCSLNLFHQGLRLVELIEAALDGSVVQKTELTFFVALSTLSALDNGRNGFHGSLQIALGRPLDSCVAHAVHAGAQLK